MNTPVRVEIIGYRQGSCGPFPCDDERTCGLEDCHPDGDFSEACEALRRSLRSEFGEGVEFRVTLLDDGVPDRVKELVEAHRPPIPLVLVNDRILPIGRVSFTHLRPAIEQARKAGSPTG